MHNLKESFHEFALKEIPKGVTDKLDDLFAIGDQSGAALLSSQFIYNYQQDKINFLLNEVESLKKTMIERAKLTSKLFDKDKHQSNALLLQENQSLKLKINEIRREAGMDETYDLS